MLTMDLLQAIRDQYSTVEEEVYMRGIFSMVVIRATKDEDAYVGVGFSMGANKNAKSDPKKGEEIARSRAIADLINADKFVNENDDVPDYFHKSKVFREVDYECHARDLFTGVIIKAYSEEDSFVGVGISKKVKGQSPLDSENRDIGVEVAKKRAVGDLFMKFQGGKNE
jgi:hypothetical protein